MKTINEIRKEALKFRELLNNCDKSNTELVIDCFPIMNCKLSSMLVAYHFKKMEIRYNQLHTLKLFNRFQYSK